jgi:hypothetical protein
MLQNLADDRCERSTSTDQDQGRSLGRLHIGSRRKLCAGLLRELGSDAPGRNTTGLSG